MTVPQDRSQPRRPNVLFIVVDDLRPQLGCYGRTQTLSPNIDGLAASGVTFTRAFCQIPVCGASRASLLKGARPTRERFINYYSWACKDMPEAVSLPAHFKQCGYATSSVGKVYHHNEDETESWSVAPWRPTGDWFGNWRSYVSEESREILKRRRDAGKEDARGPAYEAADVADNAYPDGCVADKAIDELRRLSKGEEPFFLAAGFFKPHLPFNAPLKYWEMYDREKVALAPNPDRPEGAPDAAMHNWGELRQYFDIPAEGPLTDEMARTLVHGYYACVSYTDAQIGKVLAELDALGLGDDTIVVFWGDHGWQLGEHGLWCKHCNFMTSLNAPLIVRAPGKLRGATSGRLAEFVDVYPTLCDLAGLEMPPHLEGRSLVPLLDDANVPWRRAAFSRYQKADTVATERHVYTEYTDGGEMLGRMLYDHDADPDENVNIAGASENEKVVAELRETLHAGWRAERDG